MRAQGLAVEGKGKRPGLGLGDIAPPRPARLVRPRGRSRTPAPMHPALAEFLRAIGQMAGDAVLAKYREAKGLAPASIKSPRAFYRTQEDPDDGENGERFDQGSMKPEPGETSIR